MRLSVIVIALAAAAALVVAPSAGADQPQQAPEAASHQPAACADSGTSQVVLPSDGAFELVLSGPSEQVCLVSGDCCDTVDDCASSSFYTTVCDKQATCEHGILGVCKYC